jgi:magnesium chelatase family protein
VQRYHARISGPILDRIDVRIELGTPPAESMGSVGDRKANAALRQRIHRARDKQARRYAEFDAVHCNAQAGPQARRTFMRPRHEAAELLRRAMSRWNLSARAYERTLAVARSIADLEGSSDIDAHHVGEALQYRLDSSAGR